MTSFSFAPLSSPGSSSCTFDSCADSRGASTVRQMAQSNAAFMSCFVRAWEKMANAGPFNLKTPGAGDRHQCKIENSLRYRCLVFIVTACENNSQNCPGEFSEGFCKYEYLKKRCRKTCKACNE